MPPKKPKAAPKRYTSQKMLDAYAATSTSDFKGDVRELLEHDGYAPSAVKKLLHDRDTNGLAEIIEKKGRKNLVLPEELRAVMTHIVTHG